MTDKRIENANFLTRNLETEFVPHVPSGHKHVFHQYTVRIKENREDFSKRLHESGIGNDVYYPTQVHKLPSFAQNLDLLETEAATKEALSLPVHPGLSKKDLRRIVSVFNSLLNDTLSK
jgi:dTDP-4-amino-4,6-dideoxygalactose transaminase